MGDGEMKAIVFLLFAAVYVLLYLDGRYLEAMVVACLYLLKPNE
jgi:hypothetical protein